MALMAIYGALASAEDCGLPPEEPVIGDGASLSFEELRQTHDAVNRFIAAAGSYLVCASVNREALLGLRDYEQQAAWLQEFERLQDSRRTIADRFNAQVAAFQMAHEQEFPLGTAEAQ